MFLLVVLKFKSNVIITLLLTVVYKYICNKNNNNNNNNNNEDKEEQLSCFFFIHVIKFRKFKLFIGLCVKETYLYLYNGPSVSFLFKSSQDSFFLFKIYNISLQRVCSLFEFRKENSFQTEIYF